MVLKRFLLFALWLLFALMTIQRHEFVTVLRNALNTFGLTWFWLDTLFYAALFCLFSYIIVCLTNKAAVRFFYLVYSVIFAAFFVIVLSKKVFFPHSVAVHRFSEDIVHFCFSVFPLLAVLLLAKIFSLKSD
jgi:hypothetical protein